jgi:phage FluMu protein Com
MMRHECPECKFFLYDVMVYYRDYLQVLCRRCKTVYLMPRYRKGRGQ